FKNSVDSDTKTLYGVLDFDLTPSTLLRLGAMYQKTHDVPDYFGIPMAVGGVDSGLPAHTFLGSNWSTLNFEKYNAFAELEHQFNDDWKISANINSNWNKSLQKVGGLTQLTTSYTGINSNTPNLKMNNFQKYNNSSDELTARVALSGKYSLFHTTHELFATLDYSSLYELSDWKSIVNNTAYNVWTFSPSQVQEPDWNKNLSHHIFYNNYVIQQAASLGTRLNFPKDFHLILGGRYTQSTTNGSVYYETYNGKPDGEYAKNREVKKNKLIPYIGLTYDLTPNTSLYASHTEIFKPQSFRNIKGEILDPIVGKNQEIGIKSELFNHRLNASLALFNIEQQNRPLTDPRNINFSIPEGKVRSHGIDIEISGKVTDDLAIFAGYTFNKSKYLQTESSRYLAGSNFSKHTPEHIFRMYTQYQLPGIFDKWSTGMGLSTQTETSSLYDIHQGGYTLWNANLRYTYSENLSFNLIGENLTNKRYYENNRMRMNGGNNFLGEPRSMLFRVDWKY
ncbi:TonB-dependent receptor, partial [Acinetobacter nectaris]